MRTMTTSVCTNCDKVFELRLSDLNRGRGRFCGKSCASSGRFNSSYRHGNAPKQGQSKEYKTWAGVKSRVLHGNSLNRKYYKGRGIKMCDEWLNSFENFYKDMGEAPSKDHQIDRIDVNGDYEPSNCRWVTRSEQMNNTRQNKLLTYGGKTMTQEQWGREVGLSGTIICKRLKRGWSVGDALTKPNGYCLKKTD